MGEIETLGKWQVDRLPKQGCFVVSQHVAAFQIFDDGRIHESLGQVKVCNVMTPMYVSDDVKVTMERKAEILRSGILDVLKERMLNDLVVANSLIRKMGVTIDTPFNLLKDSQEIKLDELLAHAKKNGAEILEAKQS